MTFLEQFEAPIRLGVFAGVFILMASLEAIFPRKARVQTRGRRWLTNWTLVIIDTAALRIFVPVLAVGMANIAAQNGWGLFNLLSGPAWLKVLLAIALLDLAVYAQHVASHRIPILWRFHKVHHADRDIDVTTGARFHPAEIVFSMGYKLACVVLLGAPAIAVFLFEIMLNASAMFNHSNVRLPSTVDRLVRLVVITPDMHRVHHAVHMRETNSNYGFFLSAWDKLFGTYIDQPKDGHDAMAIGLAEHQDEKPASLLWSLLLPFRPVKSAPAQTRRAEASR
ncbi:MAG: sterol desaturase family protein [Pseudomonadota bacterium]